MQQAPLLLRFEGGSDQEDLEVGGDEGGGASGEENHPVLFATCNATTTARLPPLPLHPPSCIVKLEALLLSPDRSRIAASDHVRVLVDRARKCAPSDDGRGAALDAAVRWQEGACKHSAHVLTCDLSHDG